MTIVSTSLLETFTPSVSTQADQNIINQKVSDNIETLRKYGIGLNDVSSLHIHDTITADNFTLIKRAGFISFYQFNSSGAIDGVFESTATLEIGSQFLLVNKATTPTTNTTTINLGSYSLLGSSDTSIILNSNSVYVYLVYIGSNKFIRFTYNTNNLLTSDNNFTGDNNFDGEFSVGANVTNSGIELGNSNSSSGLVFLDMKFGISSTQDYNVRLLNNANESLLFASNTKTWCSFDNTNFAVSLNILPTANNTYSLGNSTNKFTEVWAVNGTIQTSDKDKKENIKELNLGLDFIMKLKPVSWKWKNEDSYKKKETRYKKVYDENNNFIDFEKEEIEIKVPEKKFKRQHQGLLSSDVKNTLDELKISTNDFAGYIKDSESGEEALRYTYFIAPIIKAVQEQQQKIEELKQEIEILKNAQ